MRKKRIASCFLPPFFYVICRVLACINILVTCVMSFLILLLSSDTIQEIYIRMNLIKQSSPFFSAFSFLSFHSIADFLFSLSLLFVGGGRLRLSFYLTRFCFLFCTEKKKRKNLFKKPRLWDYNGMTAGDFSPAIMALKKKKKITTSILLINWKVNV